jgi:hypothetical protein
MNSRNQLIHFVEVPIQFWSSLGDARLSDQETQLLDVKGNVFPDSNPSKDRLESQQIPSNSHALQQQPQADQFLESLQSEFNHIAMNSFSISIIFDS